MSNPISETEVLRSALAQCASALDRVINSSDLAGAMDDCDEAGWEPELSMVATFDTEARANVQAETFGGRVIEVDVECMDIDLCF